MTPSIGSPYISAGDRRLLRWYDRLWRAAIPLLKHHPRLATGYAQRRLLDTAAPLPRADLWWQAASAGEAFLAVTLSEALGLRRPTRLLVTTQTRQGCDILENHAARLRHRSDPLEMTVRYLPFDRPALMARAVSRVRPRLAVLLETELWPGLMLALRVAGIPLSVINARMSQKSRRHYGLRPRLWPTMRPEAILALSSDDARRFADIFGHGGVTTMPNIKFDRVNAAAARPSRELMSLFEGARFGGDRPLVVFGSVRSAEEQQIEALLVRLHQRQPHALLALFPRHMERLNHWQSALNRRNLPWVPRSRVTADHPVIQNGGVVLWDTFGELGAAYAMACGAYVGGSLVPLGGQNFLEPLAQGVRPVIGPHWENFAWVGREVVRRGLVREVRGVDGAFQALSAAIARPPDADEKKRMRTELEAYLAPRRGGSAQAAALIRSYLAQ